MTSQQILSVETLGQLTWSNAKRFHRLPDIIGCVISQRLVTGYSRCYSAPKSDSRLFEQIRIGDSTWMIALARMVFQLTVGFVLLAPPARPR